MAKSAFVVNPLTGRKVKRDGLVGRKVVTLLQKGGKVSAKNSKPRRLSKTQRLRKTRKPQIGGGVFFKNPSDMYWKDATPYQNDAVVSAIEQYKRDGVHADKFLYSQGGYKFDLELKPGENVYGDNVEFKMTRENGTTAVLWYRKDPLTVSQREVVYGS